MSLSNLVLLCYVRLLAPTVSEVNPAGLSFDALGRTVKLVYHTQRLVCVAAERCYSVHLIRSALAVRAVVFNLPLLVVSAAIWNSAHGIIM